VVFSHPLEEPVDGELFSQLTAAQRQVASMVLQGRTNAEIATSRGTAVSTVAKQLETIYRRLGIHSRSDLAALAAGVSPRR
jgi:DNA-binding CsgD family transcriptional regulator